MKRTVQFLAIITVVILTGCQKDGLTYLERKLVGEWTYTKAKYTRDWTITPKDVTSDFDQFTLILRDDFSANYLDSETGDTQTGLWKVTTVQNEDMCTHNLFVSLTDDLTGELSQIVLEGVSVTQRKLRAYSRDNDGRYRFVLE